ncbi:multicopper oxidase family protein [Oryzomonas rubra]|uniref:Multicopper oxidase family protein n=1 Tax=Oryzomonas rubra TaxID=2509454 RepID=A0A5A9XBN8_9BACT|nr:multicopper oxidase domain-containing protein [Oryzomonas rubra]KAA0889828.1 multicopper oxidase family protein [Oryzomonas rubra]
MAMGKWTYRVYLYYRSILLAGCALAMWGCNGDTTNISTLSASSGSKSPLNPLMLQQFATPLPIIPAATADTTSVAGSDFYVVKAQQSADYDFGLRNSDGSELKNPYTGKPVRSTVWGYSVNGLSAGYLGPTIEARSTLDTSGRKVVVKYINDLRDAAGNLLTKHLLYVDPTLDGTNNGEPEIRIVPHLHGGHTQSGFDGNPLYWFTNNPNAPANGMGGPAGNTVTYTYDNDQLGTTLWYHDHAMGITRLNVYAGLAAFYILRDNYEDSLNLPKGNYEIPLVIQDKSFYEDGSIAYPTTPLLDPYTHLPIIGANGKPVLSSLPEFFGNTITVNGKVWPKLEVEPRRYRFRLLNGSDSRFYNLWIELPGGSPLPAGMITQIGNEGGLLPKPATVGDTEDNGILLALAERADLIIDFSKVPPGTKITMRNNANGPYPGGNPPDPKTTGKIMQFTVTKPLSGTDTSAATASRPHTPLAAADNVRIVDLQELRDIFGINYDPAGEGTLFYRHLLLLNGNLFSDPITEKPVLNTVEDWIIVNGTVDMHPMHLHLVGFEVVEKGTLTGYIPAALGLPPRYAALNKDTDPAGRTPLDPEFDRNYTVTGNETGLKDTVKVPPGGLDPNGDPDPNNRGYVRIRAKFDRLGIYMWHCHILSHEDNDMMRPFEVVAP